MDGNTLLLDNYFISGIKNKYRSQEVDLILAIPEGTVLFTDKNIESYHRNRYSDLLNYEHVGYHTLMNNAELTCLDCPLEPIEELEELEKIEESQWKADEAEQDTLTTGTVYEYKSEAKPKKDGVAVRPEVQNDTVLKVLDTIN